jgi:SAM-dependent methyltransferase
VTTVELDLSCCKIMENHLQGQENLEVIQGDALEFCREQNYDFVVSTFAHDHIHWDLAEKLCKNIKRNLKQGGIYFMGGELLPDYTNEEERKKALNSYHGMIVDRALKNKDYRLAQIEINALESGIGMIGDFKRDEERFEREMTSVGFREIFKEKLGPLDQNDVGGVYVYGYQK